MQARAPVPARSVRVLRDRFAQCDFLAGIITPPMPARPLYYGLNRRYNDYNDYGAENHNNRCDDNDNNINNNGGAGGRRLAIVHDRTTSLAIVCFIDRATLPRRVVPFIKTRLMILFPSTTCDSIFKKLLHGRCYIPPPPLLESNKFHTDDYFLPLPRVAE